MHLFRIIWFDDLQRQRLLRQIIGNSNLSPYLKFSYQHLSAQSANMKNCINTIKSSVKIRMIRPANIGIWLYRFADIQLIPVITRLTRIKEWSQIADNAMHYFPLPFCFAAHLISSNWYFSARARSTGTFGMRRIVPSSSTTTSSRSPSFSFAFQRMGAGRVIYPLLRTCKYTDMASRFPEICFPDFSYIIPA